MGRLKKEWSQKVPEKKFSQIDIYNQLITLNGKSYYETNGDIYLDYSFDHEERINKIISESKENREKKTKLYLHYEIKAINEAIKQLRNVLSKYPQLELNKIIKLLDNSTDEESTYLKDLIYFLGNFMRQNKLDNINKNEFINFNEYFNFLKKLGLNNNFKDVSENKIKLGCQTILTKHWNRIELEYFNSNISQGRDIDSFLKLSSLRRQSSPHASLSAMEELLFEGGQYEINGLLLSTEDLPRNQKNKSSYLTHTTSTENFFKILSTNYLNAVRLNFSHGRIVTKTLTENIVLIFDIKDILNHAPLTEGRSTAFLEEELTSYFPIPIQLARLAMPIEIIKNHSTHYNQEQGYYNFPFNNDLIKKLT